MKPSFALNFTDDAISLLHRTSRGWMEVGAVPLDEPDLVQAITYLRGSALGLEPRGLTTKLVIPNSQIRYLTLAASGPDAASRRTQIKAALEGRTPYAVDDLVFDWWGKGPTVQVAVVARETLDEAEAFARENRLNPVSFVAIPEPGGFGAEPWFGPTAFAATLLVAGEKVDRDQDPVQIVGRLAARIQPVVEAEAPQPPEPAVAVPVAVSEDTAAAGIADNTIAPDTADAEPMDEAVYPSATPEVAHVESEIVEQPLAVTEDIQPTAAPEALLVVPEPAARVEVPITEKPSVPAPLMPPSAPTLPQTPSVSVPPSPVLAADTHALRKTAAPIAKPPVKTPVRALETTKPSAPVVGSARLSAVPQTALPRNGKLSPPEAEWPLARVTASARSAQGKAEVARSASMITAPGIPMPRDRKLTIVPPSDAAAKPQNVKAAGQSKASTAGTTAFGGAQARQRGKPKYLGLILTAILLVLLAAVALWSSPYLASRDDAVPAAAAAPAATDANPVTVAAPEKLAATLPESAPTPVSPDSDPLAATDTVPTADDEMLADEQDPADFAAPVSSDAVIATVEPAATAADGTAAAVPPATPPVETATVLAPDTSTGAVPTPTDEPQDEIFLAMVDPQVATPDAIALDAPRTTTDALPVAQLAPPPFGTVYQFDAQGRIIPTAEGIITPEGVRLVAGRPAIVPPPRPAAPVPAEMATVLTGQPPAGAVVSPALLAKPEPAYADPALAGARPRDRPASLATAPTNDGAALAVADTTRFSSLRPRARPAAVLAAGEAALATQTAAVQAASASLVATLDGAGSGSPLAVAVSRKPAPRPANVNRAIEAAVSLAAADASLVPDAPFLVPDAPLVNAEPALAANPPPASDDPAVVEQNEPEVASAAPSIPTRASVAKQATVKNALNLSRTNLIGVFGTSANRYAMVRQPNGRFLKVEVGDRIDGGRVAAISEREVHYVKNGQTVTLSMPRG